MDISIFTNTAKSRLFLYEVVGLRQNGEADNLSYPIRRSGSVFLRVPYCRMNQVMQQIANRGGTIVRIKPLTLESGSVESNLGDREWDRDAVEEVKGEELGVTETQPTLITSQPIISEVTPITPQPETTQGQNPESSAWWVEISTTQPQVIYYFGPFDSFEEAKDFQGGYIEDLEEEGAIGITVEIKWCSPDNLTIF